MRKLKVEASLASELMAEGYTVECYLILPDADICNKKPRVKKTSYGGDLLLALSVEPKKLPAMGRIGEIWPLVYKNFFGADPTRQASRDRLEKWIVSQGGTKNHVSQFIHAYECLRMVKPDGS